VDSVLDGNLPLSVFNQAVAQSLYQEERFGLLGCDQTPIAASCTNPGGINGIRSGTAPIPQGPTSGATAKGDLGTVSGDAAVAERMSEEDATLLQNTGNALPITKADLNGGITVTGSGAEYLIADPTGEAAVGFPGRDAINPLQQLQAYSGNAGAFNYVPANSASGQPVPSSALSTSDSSVTGGLALSTTAASAPDPSTPIDFTTTSRGQLAPGSYTWSGFVYVPTTDTYTFRLQYSSSVASSGVSFQFDGSPRSLTAA
jgi:beta-glucosidase